jgi:glycosyltransferase involved in cell wall biosynthesis
VDAMLWFCAEIMPKILRQLPEAKFHIIGSKMPESVRALASDHVVTHGYVENVALFFESCLLSVAPLRFGAGVKGKTNQSMSFGVPVVSTSLGAEGMHLTHEKNILLADQPLEFAQQVIRLHRDRELWTALSRNGLRNIEEHFSSAAAKRNLEEVLVQLGVLRGAIRPGTAKGELLPGGALNR